MRYPTAALLVLLVFLPARSAAQTRSATETTIADNAAARAVISRALDLMGGAERVDRIGATRRRFDLATRDRGQGPRPTLSGNPGPIIETGHGVFMHDPAARRARIEEAGTIVGGQPYERRRVLSPAGGFVAQDSIQRVDSLSPATAAAMLASLERQLPETLLSQAWAARHRLQLLSGGRNEARVAFATDDGRMLVLVLDRSSGLLLRQEQLQDHSALGDYVHRIRYDDWRSVGAVRLPFRHIEEWVTGVRVRTMREVSLGIPAEEVSAEAPKAYAGPPQTARDSMLATGVHFLSGAYNTLLVEFDSFFVAVEPSPGTRAAMRVMAKAAELNPRKPIRHVVITHFHDDHMGGIRPFIAAGATFITTAHGAAAVRAIAEVRKGMYPDTLDSNPREPVVEVVRDRRVVEDATQRLEIRSIGSSPHADQMLVVWLPASRVLYEADVLDLDIPSDGIAMPGADTRHFSAWLERAKLDVRVIVPTHGRIGGIRDLERALRR